MSKRENKYIFVRKPSGAPEGATGHFGLGRPFYFDDRFNRIAMMGTLISTIVLLIFRQVTHTGTGSVLLDGVAYAAGFFFAYLIAQEVDPDPDRRWGALVSAFLTLAAEALLGVNPDGVVALLWMLFILRMFNRTSGSRHLVGDNILILASAFYLGMQGYWLVPIITGVAYIAESTLPDGYYRSMYLGALSFCIVFFSGRNFAVPELSPVYPFLLFAAFVLFMPQVMVAGLNKAVDDRHHEPLLKKRLQAAQAFLIFTSILLTWFGGNTSGRMFVPCLMAAVGTGLYLVLYLARQKKVRQEVEAYAAQKQEKRQPETRSEQKEK